MRYTRREFIRSILVAGGSFLLHPRSSPAGNVDGGRQPAYEILDKSGGLKGRIEQAYAIFEECRLCPRKCGVNRRKGERGFCRAPLRAVVHSAGPHFGEEKALVGTGGSGTIFFSNCNLRCVFCQNWPISHEGRGDEMDDAGVARLLLRLQNAGCHNINLVTPTHVMPNILGAVRIALKEGLRLPLVYNTSGYELPEIIRLLDGIVDIYLPDMKYTDPEMAATYSAGARDYPEVTRAAIEEMNRQVGVLETDGRDIARRGLMIRHLVMPNKVAGTKAFVEWVAKRLPKNTYVNLMAQYHVDYKAYDYPKIARGITTAEFLEAVAWAEEAGLTNLDPRTRSLADLFRRHPDQE